MGVCVAFGLWISRFGGETSSRSVNISTGRSIGRPSMQHINESLLRSFGASLGWSFVLFFIRQGGGGSESMVAESWYSSRSYASDDLGVG